MHFLKNFVAGLFTLIFGILVVATICVFSVSAFATKDNIVDKMKSVDIITEVKKIRNSGSTEGASGVTQVIDEMYSLASQFSVSEVFAVSMDWITIGFSPPMINLFLPVPTITSRVLRRLKE